MPTEAPKYRIHQPTLINGVFFDQQHVPAEIDLPASFEPRNSFEPLNEAAREAFRRRNAKRLQVLDDEIAEIVAEVDELKKAGVGDDELAGFSAVLSQKRLARAQMPRALKQVPTFGGAKPTHTLNFGIVHDKPPAPMTGADLDIDAAKKNGASDEDLAAMRLERVVNQAIAGGASPSDIEAIKEAFGTKDNKKAGEAVQRATENAADRKKRDAKDEADRKKANRVEELRQKAADIKDEEERKALLRKQAEAPPPEKKPEGEKPPEGERLND